MYIHVFWITNRITFANAVRKNSGEIKWGSLKGKKGRKKK